MGDCACDDRWWRLMLTRRALAAAIGGAVVLQHGRAVGIAAPGTPAAGGTIALRGLTLGGLANGAFVHPLVELYGDADIGPNDFIAGTTILYAAEGRRVSLGGSANCQDNAYLLALQRNLRFGEGVSIAHQASVSDSEVGDHTFFGFRSRVRNASIGAGAMVMHNTVVENVVIPPNRITPVGARIVSQAEADALPELVAADEEFKHEVQEVNLAFAAGYSAQFAAGGRSAVEGVVANPTTPFNPTATRPTLGAGVRVGELATIVGDVRIGADGAIGQRSSLRADEGTPIAIGRRARIRSRVTFHALLGTRIDVGDHLTAGDEVVIHGPVRIGDHVTIEDGAVVFRAVVEDDTIVRAGATIAGECVIRAGSIVPENAVVLTQADADALPRR
ncbi:MAG: carbonate dehydratase [Thermomicrobiales bacterium]|nr:carbonate dehydratase [Thermomicrobiales bacterium]